jgi:iron complex outermembrane receptor protein
LKAAFSNTFEGGYKGIIGNRFRYDISVWGQERGDFSPAAVATPSVFFGNPTAVGGFIATPIQQALAPILAGAGIPAASIPTIIGNVVTGLTTTLASAPMGVITFNDPNTPANAVIATYRSTNKVWVRGLDLATDVVATDRVTFDLAFSYQSRNTFDGVSGGNSMPLMSNSPASRGSLGMRYRNEGNGVGFELRSRYNEGYPVNSGVYATNVAFALGQGRTGAITNAQTGAKRCNPVPAGAFCYEGVAEAFTFDAQLSKRFDIGAQKLMWSVSASNLFDNRVRTIPGAPEIGRMIMSRLQYSF